MKYFFLLLFSIIFLSNSKAQGNESSAINLDWKVYRENNPNGRHSHKLLSFSEATIISEENHLPIYRKEIDCPVGLKPIVQLNIIEEKNAKDVSAASFRENVSSYFKDTVIYAIEKGKFHWFYELVPVRKMGRELNLIHSFALQIDFERADFGTPSYNRKKRGLFDSKLRTGNWHEITVSETGAYRLGKSFFEDNDIPINSVDARKIKIFGYGGAELPMKNSDTRPQDLEEIPSYGRGLNDGTFDEGDYLFFYAQGPFTWRQNNKETHVVHDKHSYAEEIHYFIQLDGTNRTEATLQENLNGSADQVITEYDYLQVHHIDRLTDISKYVKTGKNWFGEEFSFNTTQDFDLGTIKGLNLNDSIAIRSAVVGRSLSGASRFTLRLNGKRIGNQICPQAESDYLSPYVTPNTQIFKAKADQESITLTYEYIKPNSAATGWLNFFEINAKRRLLYDNESFSFRAYDVSGNDESIAEYRIQSNTGNLIIFDVTDIHDVRRQEFSYSNGTATFRATGLEPREYILFAESDAKSPKYLGKVENQNLHGLPFADVFIIAPDIDSFKNAARELAQFHSEREGFVVHVVSPKQIYNEFSSGTQDVSAIRDFLRYFYENASSNEEKPEYLILFGDASYDYMDRITGNTNLVPSYQSNNSTHPSGSYVSDDYYGLLDSNEGDWERNSNQMLDLSIGRLPAQNSKQAFEIVNKIKAYFAQEALGSWRNDVLFVGDDEDSNLHFRQTEKFANYVDTTFPLFNVKKIHFDAFVQELGAGGAEYPEVERRLNESIESGVLLVNYMGHGGELGWAHERVLDNNMIASWKNIHRLPLFVTATCEFSRFDDPDRTSAGENVFLNPNGGAIAMLTTTRVVFAGANEGLLNRLYFNNAFELVDGQYRTLGEIIKTTKNRYGLTTNTRNFSLLGDPTIRLAYPKLRVQTTSINGRDASTNQDTLKALSKVTIQGQVTDINGRLLNDYNGVVYPTIFDKADSIQTLGNDEESFVTKFQLRKNILYKGKATVTDGNFSFSFVVPKDISYKIGSGKISYYAENSDVDANGSFFNFDIGGTSDSAIVDDQGPRADLYLDDLKFAFGGLTGEDPTVIAKVQDDNGINTVGTGIGHELTLTLDDEEPVVVNEYYEAELDDYTKGTITYPLKDLEAGRHSLTVKVWDVANNSAEAYTEFVVAGSAELALDKILNYPNPFTNRTTFWFTHNRPGDVLSINIQVFSVSGRLVKTIRRNEVSPGSTYNNITWDGRDDFGNKIGKGVYIYRVQVESSDGLKSEAMEKLVILN